MLIAPFVSRMLRFFPPVVTGTIIAVIGISLMRVGINWVFGDPVGLRADAVTRACDGWPTRPSPAPCRRPGGLAIAADGAEPQLRRWTTWHRRLRAARDPAARKYAKGFVANISVLLGIVAGCVWRPRSGMMNFDKVAEGAAGSTSSARSTSACRPSTR